MSWIQNAFTQLGYRVLFVPETATELISGGVAPWTYGTNLDYQKCQMKLQLVKEKLFEQAAATMNCEKILIVCDRGAMDNKAYMNEEEFSEVLKSIGGNLTELRDGYDAIFHLVTAAKGAEKYYTTANNEARKESAAEAAQLDDKLIAAWTGHPHLRVIDNSTGFEEINSLCPCHVCKHFGSNFNEPHFNNLDSNRIHISLHNAPFNCGLCKPYLDLRSIQLD